MSKCLVIGGNGFIGSHVVDALTLHGHQVRVFDRFSDGGQRYSAEGVERVVGDFMNTGEVKEALSGIELVFHFLSTTTPATAESDPLMDVRTNVTGSVELLRACSQSGVERVYFASTGGAIYGETSEDLVDEESPARPISPYAIGKLSIEGYLRYFERTAGLRSTSFRISNPYGPRQHRDRKQGVIPIFLRRLLTGHALQVFGDGSMIRDYIFVGDVAQQIAQAAARPTARPTYNIGSGQPHTLTEIIDTIHAVTGITPELEYRPAPSTYIQKVVLDTSLFRSEFEQMSTPTSLRDGIAATWEAMISEAKDISHG